MWQEQKTEGKRKARRKNISPVGILLGHKVKNFMTVIQLTDGELSDSLESAQDAENFIQNLERPVLNTGLFLYFATFLTKKVSKRIMNVGGKRYVYF